MSESRGFPAELLSFLLFGVLGVAVTAAALACFAQLMAGQGCSGSVVPILATTAVCMGSLLCALTAAFRKKARGLLTGLLQSTFLAVPLALSAIWNGTAAEPSGGATLRLHWWASWSHPAQPQAHASLIDPANRIHQREKTAYVDL
uniref:TIGR04086 family membrane protein n=1 Tax=Faecalibacterium prausnitzii TaxID=853 RepID=UPI0040259FBD